MTNTHFSWIVLKKLRNLYLWFYICFFIFFSVFPPFARVFFIYYIYVYARCCYHHRRQWYHSNIETRRNLPRTGIYKRHYTITHTIMRIVGVLYRLIQKHYTTKKGGQSLDRPFVFIKYLIYYTLHIRIQAPSILRLQE